MSKKVIKNQYGFFELAEKPSVEEISTYYKEKYYQENSALYRNAYTEEEVILIENKIGRKHHIISNIIGGGHFVRYRLW
jgi:hypothetical protein